MAVHIVVITPESNKRFATVENVLIFFQQAREMRKIFLQSFNSFCHSYKGKKRSAISSNDNGDVLCVVHYVNNMLMKKVFPDFSLTSRFSQPSTSGERQTFVRLFRIFTAHPSERFLFLTRSLSSEQRHRKGKARNPC